MVTCCVDINNGRTRRRRSAAAGEIEGGKIGVACVKRVISAYLGLRGVTASASKCCGVAAKNIVAYLA